MTTNIYDMADTWNNAGTTFTAIKMNVTDTGSNAASLLIDLQVGGTTKFNIVKDGKLRLGAVSYDAANPALSMTGQTGTGISWSGNGLFFSTSGNSRFSVNDAGFNLSSDRTFGWASGLADASAADTVLVRDAAGIIAHRLSTDAQIFRIYRTFTDASNYERQAFQSGAGYFEWAAETAGTGTDNIDLRVTPVGTGKLDVRNVIVNTTSSNTATLNNAPTSANPALWIQVKASGVNYALPLWTTA